MQLFCDYFLLQKIDQNLTTTGVQQSCYLKPIHFPAVFQQLSFVRRNNDNGGIKIQSLKVSLSL
mgnify:CR=1 FL=1